MKSTTFALGSLLASVAIAQPHKHQAFHRQHKREAPVEWVTELEYTTEIVQFTTTIWVPEGYVAPTAAAEAPPVAVTETPAQVSKPAPSSSTLSSVYVAPPVPASSSSAAPPPVATTPVSVESVAASVAAPVVSSTPDPTPTPSPTPAPASSPSPSPIVAAAVPEVATPASSVAPVVEAPIASVVESVAPIVSSVAAAPAPVASSAGSSSSSSSSSSSAVGASSGTCEGESNLCGGDITYYDTGYPGYGSCGEQTDGTKVAVIALPHELMGLQSNGNPYCGRMVTINYGGKSVQAQVVDKCMGCTDRSIDLSHYAFQQLSDEGIGRTQATWYFSD